MNQFLHLTELDNRIVVRSSPNLIRVTAKTVGPQGEQGIQGNPGIGIPVGGTTGQILAKLSNTNYDAGWVNASAGGGAVDSVNAKTGIVLLTQDDVGDGTTYKQYSATEKTKLSGIATAATANDTNANLRNRATHTGTQLASTISDLTSFITSHVDVAANTAARHTHSNMSVLNATTASFLTADRTKLDGIEPGAQVNNISNTNATDLTDGGDSTLHFHSADRDRANHTGTQLSTTISDFGEAVEDLIGTRLTAGTNITISYNDTTGFTTINSTGGGGGSGDVVGPASSTDNAIARFDTTTGKLIQSSLISIDDNGSFVMPDSATGGNIIAGTVNGTMIGTATSQKIGLWGAIPVTQQSANTEIFTALSNVGIRGSGGTPGITVGGTTQVNGPFRTSQSTITTATTLTVGTSRWTQLADATAGAFTVTVANTGAAGWRFHIKKIDGSANAVTVQSASSSLIDGASTYVLATQYKYVVLETTSTAGTLYVVGNN